MAIISAKLIGQKIIEQALINAFELWASEDINDAHWRDQFTEEKWKYFGITKRRNGETVGPNPRDIYDLGLLYESGVNSYKFETGTNGATARWHWDAKNANGVEYASYVHDGTRFMDDRPFTDDIAIAASFFRKGPGKALQLRTAQALERLNAA